MERVSPRLGSNNRVSWSISPPSSMMSIWRRASYSMACPMKRIEFTFLISQRVPSSPRVCGRTRLHRRAGFPAPYCHRMCPDNVDSPQFLYISLRFARRTHIGTRNNFHQRHAGTVQINKTQSGCWSCSDLPASCSRCRRSMPTFFTAPPSRSISISPSPTIG